MNSATEGNFSFFSFFIYYQLFHHVLLGVQIKDEPLHYCYWYVLLYIKINIICTTSDAAVEWKNHSVSNLTLGCSRSPEMVDGPEDEPEGPLLITADPQNLHGCLQLGKLLGGPLLILSLADSTHIMNK